MKNEKYLLKVIDIVVHIKIERSCLSIFECKESIKELITNK